PSKGRRCCPPTPWRTSDSPDFLRGGRPNSTSTGYNSSGEFVKVGGDAVVLAGALLGLLALAGDTQEDKTFEPSLKKFHDDYYKVGAKDDEKISALNTLAQYRHERIVKVLAPLMKEASLPVRIMTARALSLFVGVEAAPREMLVALQ